MGWRRIGARRTSGIGLSLAAILSAGCSGKVILDDPAPGGSAGQPGADASDKGSSGAPTSMSGGPSADEGGGPSVGGSAPSAAGSSGAPTAWPVPAGGSGSSEETGTLLDPKDGWVYRESNRFGIQGAVFAYADPTSALSLMFDSSRSAACIRGKVARVDLLCTPVAPATDCYGSTWGAAIGMNLNQRLDPVTMMGDVPAAFDASNLSGFSFELSGSNLPPPNSLRFNVDSSDRSFCNIPLKKLMPGRNTVLFSEVVPECYRSATPAGPTAESARAALLKIWWQVLTNTQAEVPYDFCVSNIHALRR